MDRLYEKLITYNRENYYPMHMPGHKRNLEMLPMDNPYAVDITEIEGFDNLHQAEGILKLLSVRLSYLYGAGRSYPLINGSTGGILAGISAATQKGDKILIARNSHKSVYHAAVLRELCPVYYYPPYIEESTLNGGILTSEIEELLITHKDIRLVVITSPTYEGIVSDIRQVADTVHLHGALLLVDEAHGAHFGFHKDFPESAVRLGADIVIQSLHKTLPSFTQTAVLHCNREELNRSLEKYLAIYQSSSPSYLLLAGIDRCVSMLEEQSDELFASYHHNLMNLIQALQTLKKLKLMDRKSIGKFGIFDIDSSKLVISVRGTDWSGHKLQEILCKKYHMVMEMEASEYVLGMTSICDTEEGFLRLRDALLEIDSEMKPSYEREVNLNKPCIRPEQVMVPSKALEKKSEYVKLSKSSGRISAAFVSLFPPGSPIIIPGERIEKELLQYINHMQQQEITITGLKMDTEYEIEVLCERL